MENTKKNATKFPWVFFLLAIGITWLIWSPGIFATLGWIDLPVPFIVFFFIGTWGPFLAAIWVTYLDGGKGALRAFIQQGFDFRFPKIWLLLMVAVALVVSAVPLGIHLLAGGTPPTETLFANPLMILPVFMTYFLTGGGNEEWGWRGYALEPLQRRWNPLIASLILGLIWGCWHIPLFFIESTGQYHMSLWIFMLVAPGSSVLHTWVYNRTGKKLLAAWLFHAILGTAWELFPIVQPYLDGYQNMYVYDFIAVTAVAILVLLIEGVGLGERLVAS